MVPEVLEKTLRKEMRDLNLEFLKMMSRPRDGTAFGLPSELRGRLAQLPAPALLRLARTPCLLACLADEPAPDGGVQRVADAPAQQALPDSQAEIFAAGLLTWLWQLNRQSPALAALYAGCFDQPASWLADLDFGEIQRRAGRAAVLLRARFAEHPRCWPDLLEASVHPDREMLRLARVALVQLGLACAPADAARLRRPDQALRQRQPLL